MGAGKGKTRRAQAAATAEAKNDVTVKRKEWEGFTNKTSVERLSLDDYYLSGANKEWTDEEWAEVVTNFFADAVAVGAVVLPTTYEAEDFEFKSLPPKQFQTSRRIGINLKAEPEAVESFEYA